MADGKKPVPGGKPAPKKNFLPGQPGEQPGDEWGGDNPGNTHGAGVDDHVFFHQDGKGPAAGRVVAHGVHGCQVEAEGGARHKVLWSRVLGLKKKAVRAGKVVDSGASGSIVEHEDGRRVFVAGDMGMPDEPGKLRDVAGLEDASRQPPKRRISDLEDFARAGPSRDLVKSDHDCEGPALCRVCQAAPAEVPLSKAFDRLADVEALAARLMGPRSVLRSR